MPRAVSVRVARNQMFSGAVSLVEPRNEDAIRGAYTGSRMVSPLGLVPSANRRTPLLIVLILFGLGPTASAFGQDEYNFHKAVGGWDISAQKGAPPIDASDVTISDARGGRRRLDQQLDGFVEDVIAFGSSRLVFFHDNRLAIIDPTAAKVVDDFYAVDTSFSPAHRFLAFTQIIPRWAEASQLYLVYDLTQSPQQNCMAARCGLSKGIVVYPEDNRRERSYGVTFFDATRDDAPRPSTDALNAMHGLRSDLFWISETRFAFLDCSINSSQIVLVDLQRGVANARVASAVIDVSAVVDASKLPVRETPIDGRAWLLAESMDVQEMDTDGARLRVWLKWHPYMNVAYADVNLKLPTR